MDWMMIYKLNLKLNKNEILLAERLFVWLNGVQTAMEDVATCCLDQSIFLKGNYF